MRLRPLPLVVVPGVLLQLVSARRAARDAFRRENRAGAGRKRSVGCSGPGRGRASAGGSAGWPLGVGVRVGGAVEGPQAGAGAAGLGPEGWGAMGGKWPRRGREGSERLFGSRRRGAGRGVRRGWAAGAAGSPGLGAPWLLLFTWCFARMPADTSPKPLPPASPSARPASGTFLRGNSAKRPIGVVGGGAACISLPFSSGAGAGAGAGGGAGWNFHTQLRAEPLWRLSWTQGPQDLSCRAWAAGAQEGVRRWVRVSSEAKRLWALDLIAPCPPLPRPPWCPASSF